MYKSPRVRKHATLHKACGLSAGCDLYTRQVSGSHLTRPYLSPGQPAAGVRVCVCLPVARQVMHPAPLPELAHARINPRKTCAPLCPGSKVLLMQDTRRKLDGVQHDSSLAGLLPICNAWLGHQLAAAGKTAKLSLMAPKCKI